MLEHVQQSYYEHEAVNWKIRIKHHEEYRELRVYNNRDGHLPRKTPCGDDIIYYEYDVNQIKQKKNGKIIGNRGAERFVRGEPDNSIYYTNSHYRGIFIRLR